MHRHGQTTSHVAQVTDMRWSLQSLRNPKVSRSPVSCSAFYAHSMQGHHKGLVVYTARSDDSPRCTGVLPPSLQGCCKPVQLLVGVTVSYVTCQGCGPAPSAPCLPLTVVAGQALSCSGEQALMAAAVGSCGPGVQHAPLQGPAGQLLPAAAAAEEDEIYMLQPADKSDCRQGCFLSAVVIRYVGTSAAGEALGERIRSRSVADYQATCGLQPCCVGMSS